VDETVTIEEAAALLGVRVPVMQALLRHQRVPGAYDMNEEGWLIPRAAIQAFAAQWAASGTTGSGERPG